MSVKRGGGEEGAAAMGQNGWEADKMYRLDSYIYDYLLKRNLQNTAKAFQAEVNVSSEPVAIDAPGGFLFEWWSVFWDIFIARTNEKHSDVVASSYLESVKEREQQQIQMQQLVLQRHAQQQQHPQQQQLEQHSLQQHRQQKQEERGEENCHFPTSAQNGLVSADLPARQNDVAASSLSVKICEDRMKIPAQRDVFDEASMKQRFTENTGQMLDSNPTTMLKSAAISAQAPGQIFHGTAGGMSSSLQQAQARNRRLQGSAQDMKTGTNEALNLRAAGADGSLLGLLGSNQAGNNLTLKGWPLGGVEQLRSGFLQHKSFMRSPHSLQHLQFLTPHQQNLLLQAQQNMTSTPGEIDSRRLQMLLSGRNVVPGRDGQSNAFAEIIPSVGPSFQNMYSHIQRTETDMMAKVAAMHQHQQSSNQQQLLQRPLLNLQPQSSNHHHTGEQEIGAVTIAMHGNLSSSFRGNEQASKNRNRRKRKQPISSPGPANSSGTANTAGQSPSSSPSTPSALSPGENISMPSPHDNASLSKALIVYGTDAPLSIGSPANQLVQMDHFEEDVCMEDNVEPFLSRNDADPRDAGSQFKNSIKGFIFREISSAQASTKRIMCCHFSSDGKLLATGGQDKKVVLWNSETLKQKSVLEEHSLQITDVRFSPSTPRLATSSFDKTVRVWDADNQGYSIRTFTGHLASVMSVDFHPNKDDLICSCDEDSEMRLWSINHGSIFRIFEGGSTQVRFQPRAGRYLAAASNNMVSILDVETQACVRRFEGHTKRVDSLCWDPSGQFVVSVSEDALKVWSLNARTEERVHELDGSLRQFSSCAFHPTYLSLLIIGSYQSLELWDLSENRTMTVAAHDSQVSAVASSSTGLVASTGHDKYVKLWR
ncbi:hypothetical protein ACP70R_030579 [Stipagrostis hirtigluma subsp. patula]